MEKFSELIFNRTWFFLCVDILCNSNCFQWTVRFELQSSNHLHVPHIIIRSMTYRKEKCAVYITFSLIFSLQGFVCAIQPERDKRRDCLLRLGQVRQGKDLGNAKPSMGARSDVTYHICYFRGFHPYETKLYHQDLWPYSTFWTTCWTRTDETLPSGLGTFKIQTQDQSPWSHWIHQHCLRLTRWFPCCIRWQGWYHHALGFEWGQAPLLSGSW